MAFPLISPSRPFHVSHDVLVMSLPFLSTPPSRPCHFLGMAASFPCMSVCPLLSLRVISLHLPSCRLVSLAFISLSFPLRSFLSLSCPFQFPFVSLSFPLAFLSCRLPISSPHFLALPCVSLCSPVFPSKRHDVSSVFAEDVKKHRVSHIFGKRRQETQTGRGATRRKMLADFMRGPATGLGTPYLIKTLATPCMISCLRQAGCQDLKEPFEAHDSFMFEASPRRRGRGQRGVSRSLFGVGGRPLLFEWVRRSS